LVIREAGKCIIGSGEESRNNGNHSEKGGREDSGVEGVEEKTREEKGKEKEGTGASLPFLLVAFKKTFLNISINSSLTFYSSLTNARVSV
jgi:hypothetical protein